MKSHFSHPITLAFAFIFFGCQKMPTGDNTQPLKLASTKNSEAPLNLKAGNVNQTQGTLILPPGGTGSCGQNYSGSYSGVGYYVYPLTTLDLSTTVQGSTITVAVNSFDVPNRFTIDDSLGAFVTGTSWMGHVSYAGPWGLSLNTPESQNITFTKDLVSTFSLRVETSTQTNSDSWSASVTCASPSTIWINTSNAPIFHNQALNSIDGAFTAAGIDYSSLYSADSAAKIYEKSYISSAGIDLPSSVVDSSYGFRNKLLDISYAQNAIYASQMNFKETVDSMMALTNTSVLMTINEKTLVDSAIIYIGLYQQGSISYSSFHSDIASLRSTWNTQGFNYTLHQGDISRYVIDIADSSVAYWTRYNGGTTPQRAGQAPPPIILPLWLGLDAVGALAGGIAAGLDSYSNTGHVNWKSVGSWALGGAIASSVPALRPFRNFFR